MNKTLLLLLPRTWARRWHTHTHTHDNVFYLAPKLDVPNTDPDFGIIEPFINDYKQTDGLYNTWVSLNNDGSSGFYVFYIHTCWEGIGTIGNQVTGAVVRLEVR